jgi:hypothetical protein
MRSVAALANFHICKMLGNTTLSFKELIIYAHEAECAPFQTHCYSENLAAPGIDPGTSATAARDSDH